MDAKNLNFILFSDVVSLDIWISKLEEHSINQNTKGVKNTGKMYFYKQKTSREIKISFAGDYPHYSNNHWF